MSVRVAVFLSITVAFLRRLVEKLRLPGGPRQGSPLDTLDEGYSLFYLLFNDSDAGLERYDRRVKAFVLRTDNPDFDAISEHVIDIVWDECSHTQSFGGIYHQDKEHTQLDPNYGFTGQWMTPDELPPDEARVARQILKRLAAHGYTD